MDPFAVVIKPRSVVFRQVHWLLLLLSVRDHMVIIITQVGESRVEHDEAIPYSHVELMITIPTHLPKQGFMCIDLFMHYIYIEMPIFNTIFRFSVKTVFNKYLRFDISITGVLQVGYCSNYLNQLTDKIINMTAENPITKLLCCKSGKNLLKF